MIGSVHRILAMSVIMAALASGQPTRALAVPDGANASIETAEALAFAQAVNLRASDLTGAMKLPAGEPSEDSSPAEGLHCGRIGTLRSRPLAREVSLLNDNDELVVSAVVVLANEALAEAQLAALGSHRGRVCLARELGETVRGDSITSFAIKVTVVPVTRLLGRGAIGLHVLAEQQVELHPHMRHRTLVHTDAVLFRVGPAEILFYTLGAKRQFPAAGEGRLLTLLYARAEAHRLQLSRAL